MRSALPLAAALLLAAAHALELGDVGAVVVGDVRDDGPASDRRSAMRAAEARSGSRSTGPHCSNRGSGGRATGPARGRAVHRRAGAGAASGAAAPPGRRGRRRRVARRRRAAAAGRSRGGRATSSSVTRPPGPVPRTAPRSTPSSRARRRVEGAAAGGVRARPRAPGAPWPRRAAAARRRRRRGSRGRRRPAAARRPASREAQQDGADLDPLPGPDVDPSTRPPNGEGISTWALSVSTTRTAGPP